MITVIGSYVSPFVRKVLVCLGLKGLEDRHPDRYALHPRGAALRARARWLEEYADTRLADVLIWGVFNQAVLEPGIWGRPRNFGFARQRIDAERWPRTAGFVDRVLAQPAFTALHAFEERQVRTPIAQQWAVLAELGAPLTPETHGVDTPRRGVKRG